ncbi:MAG: ATPase, T2SS/T4P/T4SS family [Phycisphaerales bacterium]
MAHLEITTKTGVKRLRLDDRTTTIGRHPDCNLVLKDHRSSREHCVIEPIDEGFRVRDLGSRNGTTLNNRKISVELLDHHDVIRIGKTVMKFIDDSQTRAPRNKRRGPDFSAADALAFELPDDGMSLINEHDDEDTEVEFGTASSSSSSSSSSSQEPRDSISNGSRRAKSSLRTRMEKKQREREAKAFDLQAQMPSSDSPDDMIALEAAAASDPKPSRKAARFDLKAAVDEARTPYEDALREIIRVSTHRPFEEHQISLVDTRGVTVHQAVSEAEDAEDLGEGIRAFRLMLLAAFCARATDVHLEPKQDHAVARIRVDGFMVPACEMNRAVFQRIFGLVKILSQIETSRKNAVQDGHFSVAVPGRRVDYRVSFTPSMHGQKLVVRVLDTANAPTRLHELGMAAWMYEKIRAITTRDAGMLVACGPTGSGKTTTLYSALREIDVTVRNVITIEDPVEYSLEGCTQIPVDTKQGNSFGQMLRSVLRQDPDVIYVGEIRDNETAQTAMQASMTGHLVFTTVHAKDSIGAIFRMLDLGVEPYLVANSVNLIVAQRLVRLLCESCRKPIRPTPAQVMRMGRYIEGVTEIFSPTGCKRCLRTGYIGRAAIFELLEVTDELRDVILNKPAIQDIRAIVNRGIFYTLSQSGYQLVGRGLTGVDEIDRVAGSE